MVKEGRKEENKEKPRSAWVTFGGGGHQGEYLLNLEDCDIDHYIPGAIELELKKELGGDWSVSNRGTRIEIVNVKEYGSRDDQRVRSAVEKVLGPRGYLLKE